MNMRKYAAVLLCLLLCGCIPIKTGRDAAAERAGADGRNNARYAGSDGGKHENGAGGHGRPDAGGYSRACADPYAGHNPGADQGL